MKPTIGFIGLGKVGQTMALTLQSHYAIKAMVNRTPLADKKPVHHLFESLYHKTAVTTMAEVWSSSDLIFMTVADDAIESVATQLAHLELDWHNKAIVHTSGASSLDKLVQLHEQGAMVGSLHPALPFANVDLALEQLSQATFAIEADVQQLNQWLEDLVHVLGGNIIRIPTGQKALYHASLCIASNYTVTLYHIAYQLLERLGAEPLAIQTALNTLVGATVSNLQIQGVPDALTGPLSRADVTTIQSHLDSIEALASSDHGTLRQAEELSDLYRILARQTYNILQLEPDMLDKIKTVIQ